MDYAWILHHIIYLALFFSNNMFYHSAEIPAYITSQGTKTIN